MIGLIKVYVIGHSGYAVTQVLGGYAAARFGGKASLLFSIGCLSLGTMLIPTAARFDYRQGLYKDYTSTYSTDDFFRLFSQEQLISKSHVSHVHRLVVTIRVVQGLVSGIGFPSVYHLLGVWSTAVERATLMRKDSRINFLSFPIRTLSYVTIL